MNETTYRRVAMLSHCPPGRAIPLTWLMVWYWAEDVKAGGFVKHNADTVCAVHMGVN